MEQIWQQLWNAGIPLFILAVGIVVIWKTWRADMKTSEAQRDDMVKAIRELTARIDAVIPTKS
jgi:predicted negative regulator of RcsB-dependent stress response